MISNSSEIKLSDEARSLSQIPLFKQLDQAELEKLAERVEQVSFTPGQAIFNDDEQGDALYVVESGAVRIWVRDEDVKQITLSELKAGDFFGELAVLDRGVRSANATAIGDTNLHRLHRDDFHQFLLQHPSVGVDLISEIGARIRQTNALISQRAARNINAEIEKELTFGQRVADRVASFGGSWTFIIIYGSVLVFWMALNTFLLVRYATAPVGAQFDPYPYILLNLVLSMTAAMQAPVILMSQKRASLRDRFAAEQDFKVNLKSEIMLDELTLGELVRAAQMEQLANATQALQMERK